MMLKLMFFAASLLSFCATCQAQTIYTWRDTNGVLNYSDKPSTVSSSTVFLPTVKPFPLGSAIQPITPEPITLDFITATPGGTSATGGTSPVPRDLQPAFFATFGSSPFRAAPGEGTSEDGIWWVVQAKGMTRATIVNIGRDGGTALRLHTEPGDQDSYGPHERNDVSLGVKGSDCYEGKEQWWEHSILFPDDYNAPPPGQWHDVMDFHDTGVAGGQQPNFTIFSNSDGTLKFQGWGGVVDRNNPWPPPGKYGALVGPRVKNQWYDFVYHVKWSSGSDGFMQAWVNGVQKLDHRGPTLYKGNVGCYFKPSNYHSKYGQPVSVIHDRVIRYDVVR